MNFIEQIIMEDFFITPNEIYNKIITELWNDMDTTPEYPIGFAQAFMLDQTYVRKGGNFWLNAFGRPEENKVFEHESKKYVATNCGIFTFTIIPIDMADQIPINQLESSV